MKIARAGWTTRNLVESMLRRPLLVLSAVALLLTGALANLIGAAFGLASFGDAGIPDTATILKIQHFVDSGNVYPDPGLPPYQVTTFGPLTYVLLSIPYRLANWLGLTAQLLLKCSLFGAFCLCVSLIFGKGQADSHEAFDRGFPLWDEQMWGAVKQSYRPACVFEDIEIWLPKLRQEEMLPRLLGSGCVAIAK